MIEGIDSSYKRIADAVVSAIPEIWSIARVEVVFYSDSSDYSGEYLSEGGKEHDLEVTMELTRAFRELRHKFKDAGRPLWGQACFELQSDGKFNMKWGYDNCDENGDTIWNAQEWRRRQEERRQRLRQP